MDSIKILNANVLNGSLEEIIRMSDEAIQSGSPIFGTGINLNQLYLMQHNADFANAIDHAVLCPPDGTSIMWIAGWMGTPLKQKVVGPSDTLALCELAAQKHYKVLRNYLEEAWYIIRTEEGLPDKTLEFGRLSTRAIHLPKEAFCITNLQEDTGYAPAISFSEGVHKMIENYRKEKTVIQ